MLSLKTKIGWLRFIAFLEGTSLLFLVFVAVPMKYLYNNGEGSRIVGPIHGALFIWFVINTLMVGIEQKWKFKETTWKVLVASFIPFGTFYIDKAILSKIKE